MLQSFDPVTSVAIYPVTMKWKLVLLVAFAISACDGNSSSTCVVNCGGTIAVDAGEDLTVFEGETVLLVGSASYAGNSAVAYEWRQVTGPGVVLLSPNEPIAEFVAPLIANVSEQMVFELSVTASDGAAGFDRVVIDIEIGTAGACLNPDTRT